MAKFVFYITNHGFGHASRNVPVIRSLLSQNAGNRVIIKSDAARCAFLKRNFPDETRISYVDDCNEYGLVMTPGHMYPDVDRMYRLVREDLRLFDRYAAREEAFLRECRPDVVIADIICWALRAADSIGIPSLLIGNFSWAQMYRSYFGEEIWKPYEELYGLATRVLWYALHDPALHDCNPRYREISLISRDVDPGEAAAIRQAHTQPLIFVSAGGSASLEASVNVGSLPYDFVCTSGVHLAGSNVTRLSPDMINTPDYIAASDYCIAKGGWSTVAEILLARKKCALLFRGENPEDDQVRRTLSIRGHCVPVNDETQLGQLPLLIEQMDSLQPSSYDIYRDDREIICREILNLI